MKDKIGLVMARAYNVGDLLNIALCKKLFGIDVKRTDIYNADAVMIGSMLQSNIGFGDMAKSDRPLYVWGTGFIQDPYEHYAYRFPDKPFPKSEPLGSPVRPMEIKALRGEITKQRVERTLGHSIDCPLCDPAVLSDQLVPKIGYKKYAVGIIPHYVDKGNPLLSKLKFANSTIIDTEQEPEQFLKQLQECEVVLTSSLHGMIIADSFGIPNIRLKMTDKIIGGDYKFHDYYSSYGKNGHFWLDLRANEPVPTLNTLVDRYPLKKAEIDAKKTLMYNSFPYLGR